VDDIMLVKDLIMLLKQCDENKDVEIINDDYGDIIVLYPYNIEENDGNVEIQTTDILVNKSDLKDILKRLMEYMK